MVNEYIRSHVSAAAQKRQGFTLIELMIVVAIVGILAAIAFPSYQAYLVKGRRVAAQAALSNVAQLQQQYYLDTRTYAADVSTLNFTPASDVSSYYAISIAVQAGPPPGFVVTATPNTGPQRADGALSIDNVGVKTSANNSW